MIGRERGTSGLFVPWSLIFLALPIFLWIPLAQDVIWLIHCAQKWMAGGRPFSVDFEELNPPFNVALYLPLAWLVNHSPLSAAATKALAVWGVMVGVYAGLSRQLQYQEQNGILSQSTAHHLRIAFVIALFLIPAPENGQREHFLLALTLPYLVMATGRVSGISYSLYHQLPWAFLAGLGFIIKPQTLLIPLLVEGFIALYQRRFWAIFNPTSLTMAAVFLGYGLWIYTAFPQYINFYIPLLQQTYDSFGKINTRIMVGKGMMVGIAFLLFFSCLCGRKSGDFKPSQSLWLIVCIGLLITVLWQGKFFLYHFFPFLGVTTVFFASFATIQKHSVLLLTLLISSFFYTHSGGFLTLTQDASNVWDELKKKTSVRRVTFLSAQSFLPDSLLQDPSLVYGSRYMSMWFAPWILSQEKTVKGGVHNPFQSYFLNAVAEDIQYYKPQLIFLEKSKGGQLFLVYLKQHPSFQKEWRAFIPLKGDFRETFVIYIHRDVPDPEKVTQVLEKVIKQSSL